MANKAQKPAEGILLVNEWGQSKMYKVVCGCGQEWHEHNVDIEASDTGVDVVIYGTVKTDYVTEVIKPKYDIDSPWLQEFDWFWKELINSTIRKIKLTWELWTSGAITVNSTIAMSEQQALNYAEALKTAVADVKEFRKQRNEQIKNS